MSDGESETLNGDLEAPRHSSLGPSRVSITSKGAKAAQRGRVSDSAATCKVCGESGHAAGFVGAVYLDCPVMACYLCKKVGHTTATCPHRVPPLTGLGVDHATLPDRIASELERLHLPIHEARGWSSPFRMFRARQTSLGHSVSVVGVSRMADSLWPCIYRRKNWVADGNAALPDFGPWRIAAVLQKHHSRRITALAFHPSSAYASLLVGADKAGGMSVWDVVQRRSRIQVFAPHRWQVNGFDWHAPSGPGTVVSASADGTVALVDLDAGAAVRRLLDLNTGVDWSEEVATAGRWRMATAISAGGLDARGTPGGLIFVGDDVGRVWALDSRLPGASVGSAPVMRRGGKVTSVHAHPAGLPLLLTAGNDRCMRVWDVRRIAWANAGNAEAAQSVCAGSSPGSLGAAGAAPPLALCVHPRTVSSAYWSPLTGERVVSTCIDNRLRVWDNATLRLGSAAPPPPSSSPSAPPSRTYVHSHEQSRYLSAFRAVWDPKDPAERTVVIGRYISEAFGAVALHPVDVLDVGGGGPRAAGRPARPAAAPAAGGGQATAGGGVFDDGVGLLFNDSDDGGGVDEPARLPGWRAADTGNPLALPLEEGNSPEAPLCLLAQLVDPLLPTIAPVNAVHPRWAAIASGSSNSIYLWGPVPSLGGERRFGSTPSLTRDAHQLRWSWRGGRDGGSAPALARAEDHAEGYGSSSSSSSDGNVDSGGLAMLPATNAKASRGGGRGVRSRRRRSQQTGVAAATPPGRVRARLPSPASRSPAVNGILHSPSDRHDEPAVMQSNKRRRSVPPSPDSPHGGSQRAAATASTPSTPLRSGLQVSAADATASACIRLDEPLSSPFFVSTPSRSRLLLQQDASAVVNTTFVPTVGSGAPSSFAVTQAAANEAPRMSGGRESTASHDYAIDAVETVPDGIPVEQLSRQLSPQAPPHMQRIVSSARSPSVSRASHHAQAAAGLTVNGSIGDSSSHDSVDAMRHLSPYFARRP